MAFEAFDDLLPPSYASFDVDDELSKVIQILVASSQETFNKAIISVVSTRNHSTLSRLQWKYNGTGLGDFDDFLKEKAKGQHFLSALKAVIEGPVLSDHHFIELALKKGDGQALSELLLGRESSELAALSLERLALAHKIDKAFSGDKEACDMFKMALICRRPPSSEPVDMRRVELDILMLYCAVEHGQLDQLALDVLLNRSTPHLSKVIEEGNAKCGNLTRAIKKNFSGALRQGLLHIVRGANPKRDGAGIYRDAKYLHYALTSDYETYKGKLYRGVKTFSGVDRDDVLRLIVRLHWDAERRELVEREYMRHYNTTLRGDVEEALSGPFTDGSFRELMLGLLKSRKNM